MARSARRRLALAPAMSITALALMSTASLVAAQPVGRPSAPTTSAPAAVPLGDADYRKGQDFLLKQNYAEAMRAYRAAAAQGNAAAQYGIGDLYFAGWGVPKDYREAMHWYLLAAAQGVSEAQGNAGTLYMMGWGVPQDYKEAMYWLRKAADQGNEASQRTIGIMYFKGLGVAQDRTEAIRWFRMAAENGDNEAKGALKQLGVK